MDPDKAQYFDLDPSYLQRLLVEASRLNLNSSLWKRGLLTFSFNFSTKIKSMQKLFLNYLQLYGRYLMHEKVMLHNELSHNTAHK